MDVVLGVVAALLLGLPWVGSMLSQSTADVSGYLDSASSRELPTGSAREVGTSGAPLTGVPTSSTTWRSP